MNAVAVERDERGGRMTPRARVRRASLLAGERVAEAAGDAVAAERLGAGDAVGVERVGGAEARGDLGDAAQRVGVVERALELGVDDRVDVAGFVPAGVADGLLAVLVGPAGAVGDHVAVVGGEQVADERLERVQLGVGGVDQAGADVVAEAEVGAGGVGVAGAGGAGGARGRRRRLRAGRCRRGGRRRSRRPRVRRAASVWSSCSRMRSSMKTGSTTQMPAAKSWPRSWT